MKKTISIIVPVYNAEKTLRRCVDSLTGQSYSNIEIFLVNDGSKDASLRLCRELAEEDERIHIIDKPNGGVSSARNAGLDAACGEYIMFCDSDDWVAPHWCESMLYHHKSGYMPVCAIAVDEAEAMAQDAAVQVIPRNAFLHYHSVMSAPFNKIYERAIIEENGLRFSTELRLGEDFVFVLEYLCCIQGDVVLLPERLYYYDVSTEGSLSKRSATMAQCDLFYHRLTAAMKTLGATDEKSIYNRDWHVMTQFENMLIASAEDKTMTFCQKMELAKEIGALESFRTVSGHVITWENPLFSWLLDKKFARCIMLYLMLRTWKARICSPNSS